MILSDSNRNQRRDAWKYLTTELVSQNSCVLDLDRILQQSHLHLLFRSSMRMRCECLALDVRQLDHSIGNVSFIILCRSICCRLQTLHIMESWQIAIVVQKCNL
jgi:hypothetical protein